MARGENVTEQSAAVTPGSAFPFPSLVEVTDIELSDIDLRKVIGGLQPTPRPTVQTIMCPYW
jgi:hypothetical protein